jgi:hypothetical protein
LPLSVRLSAFTPVPPKVRLPPPEPSVMPPVPIFNVLATVPPSMIVAAVFVTVMAPTEVGVAAVLMVAVDAVVPAKLAVPVEAGIPPVQLLDVFQSAPVPPFQVDVAAWVERDMLVTAPTSRNIFLPEPLNVFKFVRVFSK